MGNLSLTLQCKTTMKRVAKYTLKKNMTKGGKNKKFF
jgi:hypothetical protein